MTTDDPRAAWERAQELIFDEIRTYGRPKTGFFAGNDVLLLGTKGAKSGEHRVSPLTFSRDGDRLVIVASKGGAPEHPDWYRNLKNDPNVELQVLDDVFPARARTAEGEERERLCQLVNQQWPDYESYQTNTDREIPVVVLERA